MYVRAYLRASTQDQDAMRAREEVTQFVEEYGHKIASYYVENVSGATLDRPELMRLLSDSHEGDVLMIEQVDRLSRLKDEDWQKLKQLINVQNLKVVSLDLPTSHSALNTTETDSFTQSILKAINNMMLDMLAAIARKDYEDRRKRQTQGIKKAKADGKFRGRQADKDKHDDIVKYRAMGMSLNEVAKVTGTSKATVCRVLAKDKDSTS